MGKTSLNVTMYGFWDQFNINQIPQGHNLYFVFAGQLLANKYCRLTRTVYIGRGADAIKHIESEELVKALKPGELLFYAVGDTTDDDEVLLYALRKKFLPGDVESQHNLRGPISVHLDGKIPIIYKEFIDFTIDNMRG